jgi:site-specific DNA-cytosine methylase
VNVDTSQTFNCVEWCFGYGGNHLGLKRVLPSLRCVAACEIEAYAIANLVAKIEAGLLDPFPIWSDVKTFPCEQFRDLVDIFVASYPCQPFSISGKRKGADDPRHLWPFVRRAVEIIRPRFCFFENVEGHVSFGLREVLTELALLGYRVENSRGEPTWGIFSAAEVGAPQNRKRVFILGQMADASSTREPSGTRDNGPGRPEQRLTWGSFGVGLADPKCARREGSEWTGAYEKGPSSHGPIAECGDDERETVLRQLHSGKADGNDLEHMSALRAEHLEYHTQRIGKTPVGEAIKPLYWPGFVSRPGEQQHEWEPPRTIETKRGLGLRSNGRADGLGYSRLSDYENTIILEEKRRAVEALSALRQAIKAQSIQWTPGGLLLFSQEKILQSGLRFDALPNRFAIIIGSAQTRGVTSRESMREMREERESANSPFGLQSCEQFQRELDDALRIMSHEVALGERKKYSKTRFNTDELRLLGNGVYPATAAKAFATLMKRFYE